MCKGGEGLSVVLRQYSSHPRGGGIHLQDKRELGVWVFENGSSAEGSLQLFKCGDGFWDIEQILGLRAQQGSAGGCEEGEVVVHVNSFGTDDITQELDVGSVELTFFQF